MNYFVITNMIELSSVFILAFILSTWYGIDGISLHWIVFYLSDRKQKVKLMDCLSSPAEFACEIPQGSVHGLMLFTLYTTPVNYVLTSVNAFFRLFF